MSQKLEKLVVANAQQLLSAMRIILLTTLPRHPDTRPEALAVERDGNDAGTFCFLASVRTEFALFLLFSPSELTLDRLVG